MVARRVWDAEAAGSTPATQTWRRNMNEILVVIALMLLCSALLLSIFIVSVVIGFTMTYLITRMYSE